MTREVKEYMLSDSFNFAKEIMSFIYTDDLIDWLLETQDRETIIRNVLLDVRDLMLETVVRKV